ncbi:DNA excision repair protein ERCC-1 isoform X2 [Pleurodeles waltl]|uniref:DNA excision repair protein ERCC-1 isoform X2 n=1 Tax=Pleurodeles waltl TaxID=8319 RepID=UPI003709542E
MDFLFVVNSGCHLYWYRFVKCSGDPIVEVPDSSANQQRRGSSNSAKDFCKTSVVLCSFIGSAVETCPSIATMNEDDGPAERKKRFVVLSQDVDIAPVKPLFRSMAGGDSSARDGSVVPQNTGTYADYVFKQAAGVSAPVRPVGGGQRPSRTSKPTAGPTRGVPKSGAGREAAPVEAVSTITAPVQEAGPVPLPRTGAEGQMVEDPTLDAAEETVAQAGTTSEEVKATVPTKAIGKGNCLVVSPRQRGNPILKFVRNVPWEFDDIVPDYVMGPTTCALFLSLRYHNLNPNYIHERLKVLGQSFALRVLLVLVDVKDPHFALKELAKICILADCTLILAWTAEEAGRYLETYKSYEQKPADVLKEKVDQDFMSKVTDCLTTVKSVNKTDCTTLLSTFGSLADLSKAAREELSLCPGLGPQKAKRLFDVLHEPFQKTKK